MPVDSLAHAPAVDVLHGVAILDPYRWLEDRDSTATREWLTCQNALLEDYIRGLSEVDVLKSRVSEHLNVEVVEQPIKIGTQLFCRLRKKNQQQACLCVRDIASGTERVLLDPSTLGPYAAVAIHRISGDGTILAYALKRGGERSEEIHFVNVRDDLVLEDHLEKCQLRGLEIGTDNAGFYYCCEAEEDLRSPHEIRYHRFGDPPESDLTLISFPRTEQSRLSLVSDSTNLGAVFVHECGAEMKIDFHLASHANHLTWRPVFTDRDLPYGPFLHHGMIYVLSFLSSPHGQVIELREDGTEESVIVPAWNVPIRNLRLATDSLYVSYLADCSTVIHRWAWTGEFLGKLPVPPEGSFGILQGCTSGSDALFFSHESFSKPPAIFEYNESSQAYTPFDCGRPPCVEGDYRTQRVTYSSTDGTSIPMWLVARETKEPIEQRPAILTGYGGFGVSMTPRFSALVAVMLDLGCIFALPNIRGGSEFGKEWHQAARRRNRQVAIDDFIIAAEWLCANGMTQPERLAIFGGSNSGLLVAAAMTQRPDLFRAVLCLAPILDMLRYEQFGNARKWREEYGSVSDEQDFHALYAYSPYHHIREEIDYPATLFVSGDKDAQCDPAHVRKMAARLQGRVAQSRPILVDYCAERGHTPVLPLSVRIDALALRVAFFCHELGVSIPKAGRG